jgi:hypothetical protein
VSNARIRWWLVVLSGAVGLILGVIGAFVQAVRWLSPVGSVPWGAVLAALVVVILVRGAVVAVHTRWAGWALLVGWLVATVVLAAESPSGDVALSGGGRQMGYLLAIVILGSAVASFPVQWRGTSPGGASSETVLDHLPS